MLRACLCDIYDYFRSSQIYESKQRNSEMTLQYAYKVTEG